MSDAPEPLPPLPYLAPLDYPTKAKRLEAFMRACAARIREMGADSVVVLVTMEDPMDGKTGCLHVGLGNQYARRGSIEVGQGLYGIEYTNAEHAPDASEDE